MSEIATQDFSECEPLVSRNILFPVKSYHTPMSKGMATLMSPKLSEQEENQ